MSTTNSSVTCTPLYGRYFNNFDCAFNNTLIYPTTNAGCVLGLDEVIAASLQGDLNANGTGSAEATTTLTTKGKSITVSNKVDNTSVYENTSDQLSVKLMSSGGILVDDSSSKLGLYLDQTVLQTNARASINFSSTANYNDGLTIGTVSALKSDGTSSSATYIVPCAKYNEYGLIKAFSTADTVNLTNVAPTTSRYLYSGQTTNTIIAPVKLNSIGQAFVEYDAKYFNCNTNFEPQVPTAVPLISSTAAGKAMSNASSLLLLTYILLLSTPTITASLLTLGANSETTNATALPVIENSTNGRIYAVIDNNKLGNNINRKQYNAGVGATSGTVVNYTVSDFPTTKDEIVYLRIGDIGLYPLYFRSVNGYEIKYTDNNSTYEFSPANIGINSNDGIILTLKCNYDYEENTVYYDYLDSHRLTEKVYTAGDHISIDSTTNAISATYTAGLNITITGDEIAATDTTYTAGTNITIDPNDNNKISATDTTYAAGTNIAINSDNEINCTLEGSDSIDITNGIISLKKGVVGSLYYTGLHALYFGINYNDYPSVSAGNYYKIVSARSCNTGKIDFKFTIVSREDSLSHAYMAEYWFANRAGLSAPIAYCMNYWYKDNTYFNPTLDLYYTIRNYNAYCPEKATTYTNYVVEVYRKNYVSSNTSDFSVVITDFENSSGSTDRASVLGTTEDPNPGGWTGYSIQYWNSSTHGVAEDFDLALPSGAVQFTEAPYYLGKN